MLQITDEQMQEAINKAYKEAGHNAYFANGFEAGVKFAQNLLKYRQEIQQIEDDFDYLMEEGGYGF